MTQSFQYLCVYILGVLLIGCQSVQKKDFLLGDDVFQTQITSYKKSKNENREPKSLIIMPPTGGTNFIDRSYAKTFAREGYDVYVVNSWSGDKEARIDLDIHQVLYTRAQKAIGLLIAEIKSPFIGLMGTSVGGLHAAVAASQQEHLNAVFVITAGAPIAEIIVNSDQSAMQAAKEKRYKKYGFKNDSEYLLNLSNNFHLEPMLLGNGYEKKTTRHGHRNQR